MKHRKLLVIIVFSVLTYLLLIHFLLVTERSAPNTTITDYYDAFWYSVLALTTGGGDNVTPVTIQGKLIGFCFILGSLGILGLLIGEISKQFIARRERKRMGLNGTSFSNHVVIIGWNSFAKSVVKQIIGAEHHVAIVTGNKDDIDLIYGEFSRANVFVLYTDLDNIALFEKATIARALMVFVNLEDDTRNLITILNIKQVYGNLSFIVTLENNALRPTFTAAGVAYALSRNGIASKLIASYIYEPDVAEFNGDLLSSAVSAEQYDIQQYQVQQNSPYINMTYGELLRTMRETIGCLLIGISKHIHGNRTLMKLPPDDTIVHHQDYLIVIANGDTEKELERRMGVKEGRVTM